MSNHTDFIVQLVIATKCISYLELGLYTGETFEKVYIHVKNCVGVDIKDLRNNKIGEFYQTTTNDFFSKNKTTFDVIFVDADHRFENVKCDLENSLKVLNKRGIIILHDTDPTDKKYLADGYCSDSYKINDYLKEKSDIMFITLPIGSEGLTLIKRFNDRKVLEFI
jgi:hypothetical protein